MNLDIFNTENVFEATTNLFLQLGIKLNSNTAEPLPLKDLLHVHYKQNDTFETIDKTYFIGIIDHTIFNTTDVVNINYSYNQALQQGAKNYNGLMLFALNLSKQPSRAAIADLTRTFNRISEKMPVALVLKYNIGTEACFSIAISERFKYKQNWRQGEKAGKVTILRDIHTLTTHAGHQRILTDLVKPNGISNYDQLHQHWLQVLDVNILNKKFFTALANWYFWAMENVSFPDDLEKKAEVRNATNLIRLITRVVFIWFIKEKALVPNALFNPAYLNTILKDFNKTKKSANYYHAILQNLFFGTLNQKMKERKFAKDGKSITTNTEEYGVKNLFRYANLFTITNKEAMELFEDVPFLNGGLFDCLDKQNEDGKIVYVDGFSRNPKKQALVPDYIFFGEEQDVDLNQIYATKNKKHKVSGLINLLNSYKFTITENTPIEEEVALDPELLGKVFENLLASYNPETQTTARKQTGSFYTPREIVNYMVDESVIEYLKQTILAEPHEMLTLGSSQTELFGNDTRSGQLKLEASTKPSRWNGKEKLFEANLRQLISYEPLQPFIHIKDVKDLIEAINNCKILDPACGSGAYPMGILHKLVHVLQKLDPGNKLWKAQQRENVIGEQIRLLEQDRAAIKGLSDKAVRTKAENAVENRLAEIEEIFESKNNFDDYARKLYLIENCIYGIDIQPIAVQISKLRFFISLIIDQTKQPNKDNFGIRSLPNLETKFVAANTLIGLDKPTQTALRNPQIEVKEAELKALRHKYFTANTRKEKLQYQKQDKTLRQAIAKMLESDGWQTTVAKQIVAFDPYDQNKFAPWFEPEWMFGLTSGFDIVIGNPPYVNTKRGIEFKEKEYFKERYKTASGQFDIFCLFIEYSLTIGNIVSFIVPKPIINNENYVVCRKLLLDSNIKNLIIGSNIFESAGVESCIFVCSKKHDGPISVSKYEKNEFKFKWFTNKIESKTLPFEMINTELNSLEFRVIKLIQGEHQSFDKVISLTRGIEAGKNDECITKIKTKHSLLRGEDVKKNSITFDRLYVKYDKTDLPKFKKMSIYDCEKILIRRVGNELVAAYDNKEYLTLNTLYNCKAINKETNLLYVLGIINSTMMRNWFKKLFVLTDKLFPYVRVSQLNFIPLKVSLKFEKPIDYLVKCINLNNIGENFNLTFFERLIDAMVYELYLPDEIKAGGAEVLKHLGNLPELVDGQDEQNLKTIAKVQKQLMHPNHPITTALQNLLTINEVNIIEGRK